MSRDFKLYLQDILRLAQRIETSLEGLTYDQFTENPDKIDAVLYNLGIMGEAVRSIPETVREQYSTIDWRRIAALRNVIVHEYFRVNLELIWSIAQTELTNLRSQILTVLNNLETDE